MPSQAPRSRASHRPSPPRSAGSPDDSVAGTDGRRIGLAVSGVSLPACRAIRWHAGLFGRENCRRSDRARTLSMLGTWRSTTSERTCTASLEEPADGASRDGRLPTMRVTDVQREEMSDDQTEKQNAVDGRRQPSREQRKVQDRHGNRRPEAGRANRRREPRRRSLEYPVLAITAVSRRTRTTRPLARDGGWFCHGRVRWLNSSRQQPKYGSTVSVGCDGFNGIRPPERFIYTEKILFRLRNVDGTVRGLRE